MNCLEVQEFLSAYYDGELCHDEATRVADHLADCSSCSDELALYEQLSGLSQKQTDPQVPAHLWDKLQVDLDKPTVPITAYSRLLQRSIGSRRLALAATILIAVGLGIVAFQMRLAPDHNHLAMNFSQYVEQFTKHPEEAQQLLLAKYYGKPMTLQEATNTLGYEPAAAKGIPPGYTIDKVYLLKMPCCGCAQIICKNKGGKFLAIFEHDIDQPVWFGDRPTKAYICHDKPTNVVELGDRLAATWVEGQRSITIIGATDLDEVNKFVAHFMADNTSES